MFTNTLERRGFRLRFATCVYFTGIAGDFWRNSFSWYGYGVLVVVIAVISCETIARCRELLDGNGIAMDCGVMKYIADAEAIYPYEGTREKSTLTSGRAITGRAAFV